MFAQVLKNTFWLTSGEVAGRFLRIILVLYSARVLGAADWGIFSYALGMAALLTVVADMGLGAVLTRQLVREPTAEKQYLSTAFFIKIFFLILAGLFIVLLVPTFTKFTLTATLLFLITLLVIADNLRFLASSVFRAGEKMHLEALTNVVTQAAIVLFGSAALLYYGGLEQLALAYASGSILGTILSFWLTKEHLGKITSAFSWLTAKKMLTAAWPFALLGLVGGIMLNTDIIMLGWLRTPEEIGYYSAGQKIIFTLYVLPSLIAAAVFPSFTRIAAKEEQLFGELLGRTLKLVFLIALPLTVGGIILAVPLITIFYGAAYQPGITAFQILLVSLLINYPATIIGNALFAYDKQNEFLKFTALGAGGNIIFNALLIPAWGIEGAALATVITQFLSNAFIWQKMNQTNTFTVFRKLPKIVLATALMGLLLWGLKMAAVNFFISLGLAVAVYFILLYLFQEPAVRELKNLFLKNEAGATY